MPCQGGRTDRRGGRGGAHRWRTGVRAMKRLLLISVLMLGACKPEPAGEPVIRHEIGKHSEEPATVKVEPQVQALPSSCAEETFEKQRLTHCIADPARHSIATALAGEDGTTFRSLKAYSESLGEGAANIAFAMNGGMFGDDGKPVGYYVENGERLKELNRSDGPGNFHMKPNGVFFGSDGKWRGLGGDAFSPSPGGRPPFGPRPGAML